MILDNEFRVDAPVGVVWQLLDDLPFIVPCMPGASYIGREGEEHRVGIRMRVGAITTHFQGAVRFVEMDPAAHRAVIQGSGKDAGGKGAASATVVTTLEPEPSGTRVCVHTDLAITGRLAQFGGGVLGDISSRLMAQFAENLRRLLAERATTPAEALPQAGLDHAPTPPGERELRASSPGSSGPAEAAPLDLCSLLLPVALDRVRRFVVVPVTFFVLGWLAARYL